MNLRIYWKDTRLRSHFADRSGNSFFVLNPKMIEKIWVPDIFIGKFTMFITPDVITFFDSSILYEFTITSPTIRDLILTSLVSGAA